MGADGGKAVKPPRGVGAPSGYGRSQRGITPGQHSGLARFPYAQHCEPSLTHAVGVSKMSNAIVAKAMWAVLAMRRDLRRGTGTTELTVPQPRSAAKQSAARVAA